MIFSYKESKFVLMTLFLIPISSFAVGETYTKEATFYSDSFIWGGTANGDIFDQNVYSAAICDIPLGQYLYVSKWNTGVVVDANDRPNCSKYPQIIDLSSEAFRLFAPLSAWRVPDVSVTVMGNAPTQSSKTFLSSDTFRHLWILLTNNVPTVVFSSNTIEVSGKVMTADQYVLLYAQKEWMPPVNKLVKVAKDKSFKWFLTLPDTIGEVVFIVASGNSFDTDKYATLSLISPTSLTYPKLPTNTRAKIIPKISFNTSNEMMMRLPSNLYGELEITQGKRTYKTSGTNFLLNTIPLSIWPASVKIQGYKLSTTSPLDRSVSYPNLFSGSVILERSHDSIGTDSVVVQVKWSNAKFRFTSPTTYKIRGKYYLTSPRWEVKEISFPSAQLAPDGYLLPWILVTGNLTLDTVGTYLLEIVREDGIAFANIPMTRGNAWPVIDPLTDEQISKIRSDRTLVIRSTVDRINTIRNALWKYSVNEDADLDILAQAKVEDMIRRGYQWHRDPDGNYIDSLAQKLSIDTGGSIGENIGYGTVSDLSLQDGLEESGVHRINMLQDAWTRVGIGYGVDNGKVYLVHIFGE